MSEKQARAIVYERSGGVCEKCGARRATNWHHRKAAGRVWTPSNGLHLCGSGTTGCHGWVTEHPVASYAGGWMVRSTFDPAECAVHYRGRWVFLGDDGSVTPIDEWEPEEAS